MEVGSESWREMIFSGAREMGIDVSEDQMDRICRYAAILLEWNRKINLTAITDAAEVAVKHFLDSMAALPHIPEEGKMLDIGSGGGFPGLVIAVFRPHLKITSVDSVRKKISFQQHVIRMLGLDAAKATHTRAETLADPNGGAEFDVVVSRALGTLELIATYALPVLNPNGMIIAYKGSGGETELSQMESLAATRGVTLSVDTRNYSLPGKGDRRSLYIIRKKVVS
jgi:16S rRNA (guanine527-N7)-methyltransferase